MNKTNLIILLVVAAYIFSPDLATSLASCLGPEMESTVMGGDKLLALLAVAGWIAPSPTALKDKIMEKLGAVLKKEDPK